MPKAATSIKYSKGGGEPVFIEVGDEVDPKLFTEEEYEGLVAAGAIKGEGADAEEAPQEPEASAVPTSPPSPTGGSDTQVSGGQSTTSAQATTSEGDKK